MNKHKINLKMFLLCVVMLFSACSPQIAPASTSTPLPTPTAATCNLSEAGKLIDQGLTVFQKFKAQVELIRSTPGIDLPGAIAKLKEIKTEAEILKANPCAGKLYGILVEGMNRAIEQVGGLLTDSTSAAREKLASGMETLFLQLSAEVTRLFKCLPNC